MSRVRVQPGFMDQADEEQRLVVSPPAPTGGRRVRAGREILGIAYDLADLIEFARRAGLDDLTPDDPVIEWHGGGPDVWM